MNFENKSEDTVPSSHEFPDRNKIIRLGKIMAFVGAGTLAGLFIALILNG